MRHDDRMNETEGKTLAQGQGMNVPGETETREEAEMSREKGQDAEEKEAAPEAPQEDAAFDRQLEEMMNGTGGKKAGKKKRGKKKFLLAAAVLAVLGIGAVKVLGGSEPSIPTAATVTPVRKEIQNRLSVSGPVSGTDSVDVVSNLHAEVLEIPVKEGDKVTKGQVLAVLDDTDLKKEVAMAKNDYDLAVSTCVEQDRDARNGYAKAVQDLKTAQDNYNRTKVLYDSGDVPLVDLETAENGLNDAKRQAASYEVKNGQAVAGDSYRLQVEKARFEYEKKQEQLADNAKKISEAGADLYNTCSILSGHFSSLGKSLNQAVAQYNKTISSFEHRFIPRAQKLKNLGVTSTKELPRALEDITEQAKSADVPDIPS